MYLGFFKEEMRLMQSKAEDMDGGKERREK
jgi:hypothetical protein